MKGLLSFLLVLNSLAFIVVGVVPSKNIVCFNKLLSPISYARRSNTRFGFVYRVFGASLSSLGVYSGVWFFEDRQKCDR